jgi:hypothetical protein
VQKQLCHDDSITPAGRVVAMAAGQHCWQQNIMSITAGQQQQNIMSIILRHAWANNSCQTI